MKLTENFTLDELTHSNVALVRKIDNTPDSDSLENLKKLATDILQPIRTKYGKPIYVSSGFRSEALNKYVGGVKTSQHRLGEAADITCRNNKELWDIIVNMINNNEIVVGQLIDEKNLSWIHISLPNNKNKNKIFSLK